MTTVEMKLALMIHFRYLQYPMVATECLMATPDRWGSSASSMADVLAIKPELMVEIEIKQHRYEMGKDLEKKARKHAFYLRTKGIWDNWYDRWEQTTIRPHKFYFACYVCPEKRKKYDTTYFSNIPAPYGMIAVYRMYDCTVLKRAKWLHRDLTHLEAAKKRMLLRLVGENIYLRLEEYKREAGEKVKEGYA